MSATFRGLSGRFRRCWFASVLQPGPLIASDEGTRFASQTFPEGLTAWRTTRGALFAGSEVRRDRCRGIDFAPHVHAALAPRLVARFNAL